MHAEDDFLPLSGLQNFAFCERQFCLIHLEKQWTDNVLTAQGRVLHNRVDDPTFTETRGSLVISRALPLRSEKLRLYGVADVVEFNQHLLNGNKIFVPVNVVEYKRGKPKIDDIDIVQMVAQTMCLEEMFNAPIAQGCLYYGEPKRRQVIDITETLRDRVAQLSAEMHAVFARGKTLPAAYKKACKSCSLLDECMPKIPRASVKNYIAKMLTAADE